MSLEKHEQRRESLRGELYDLMDDGEIPLAEKQRRALAIGTEFLGVEGGRIQRDEADSRTHEVVATVGEQPGSFEEGAVVDRARTYCRRPIGTDSTVAFADAETDGWADDPAYREHGQRCYLGTPIPVNDEVYGTVCFTDADPRPEPFTTAEKLFVELVARLLGREMETRRYEQTIDETGRARELSERKYQTLLETAPNAIVLADADTGEITGLNERAADLTGYSRADLEGMPVFEIHPESRREKYVELFDDPSDRVSRRRFDDGSQLRVERADGTTIPVEISASTVELADRTVVQGIIRDISEQRQRERELERNEEFLRRTQEAVDLGGWEIDLSTGELQCTDEIYRIYGLSPDDHLSFDTALGFFHPEDRSKAADAYERLVTEAEPFDLELRIITDDQQLRWVRVIGGPVYDDDGEEVVRFRGVTRDVTERRERESDRRLKNQVVEEASVGIFIAVARESDGRIVYVNDAFEQLTGYGESEVRDGTYSVLDRMCRDGTVATEVHDSITAVESRTRRLRLDRADGTPLWAELGLTPVGGDGSGHTVRCVGFLRDITPVKRRERLIGVLNRVLRHNMRNDMNVVGGYAATITERASGTIAELAESIRSTAADLTALGEKARTLEDTMAEPVSPEVCDVVPDVRSVVDELRREYPGAEFTTDVPEACRAVATARFRRALYELGNNAAKHVDDPTVRFEVYRTDDRVVVEVDDDGPGLSKHETAVVETGRETPLTHGQGLGLWLANWIVTGAGGDLAVEVDDGTTVRIRLHHGSEVSGETPTDYYRQAAFESRRR